jgi:hypothetical protein
MQTEPTARHSPIGSFQRVCYLVHLARDGRMAAAPGTRSPALHPDRRRGRWEGQTEVAVDLSGVGRFPKAFGAKLAHQPGSTGMGRGTGATCLVCPVLTEPPGLAARCAGRGRHGPEERGDGDAQQSAEGLGLPAEGGQGAVQAVVVVPEEPVGALVDLSRPLLGVDDEYPLGPITRWMLQWWSIRGGFGRSASSGGAATRVSRC